MEPECDRPITSQDGSTLLHGPEAKSAHEVIPAEETGWTGDGQEFESRMDLSVVFEMTLDQH